ncbi:unnamed protein product [Paramecium sonneborni]|uniref:Uncharacterized protein n=1 Tax=Paramecium sonneborni TaxID=65129 RepID=A0A8S1R568_9CILI|nr:unnamed protein product [Paramecium sonneborni]
MIQVEQSVIIDEDRVKEMMEITQCLKQIPILLDQNLVMINSWNLTFSNDENEQKPNKNQSMENIHQKQKNHLYYNMKKDGFFKEMILLNDLNFYDLDFVRLKSFESIQLDKQCELTAFSQNQRKGFQNIQSNGLMSNQIFNSKFQQSVLTGPHSSRNFESKDQTNFFISSEPQLEEKSNKWLHKYPSYIIQKTENVEKSEFPTLFKNYSQIGKNTNDISYEDQQIKQEFQTLININKLSKENQQKNSFDSSINKRNNQQKQSLCKQNENQQTKQNENQQTKQKGRRPSSPKFKFVVKNKKQTKNSGQHIKLTFEKGQKVFETSFQRLNKETSKSVDQLKINDHFLKLQNEYQRELYSKPFENTKYSEISKLFSRQTPESPTSILYKRKINKSKQNKSQNILNSSNNLSNRSDDKYSAQEFDDNFENDEEQFIHKVDLYQLLKEKKGSSINQNTDQNFEHFERNTFSFKQQPDAQANNQLKQEDRLQNNQFQITFSPQQENQRFSPITNNDENQKLNYQLQNNNFQKHENQYINNLEQNQYQYYEQKQIQVPGTKKQPIQIKLNIQQFMNNNNQEKQNKIDISQHSSKIVNQSNQYSQSFRKIKK